ncbi:MAG: hypothetical protein LBE16_02915, partial [Clostridiales Family XIII bacterium]|nr:hypothetical protein [Clostridiales Family XIII bacterium]
MLTQITDTGSTINTVSPYAYILIQIGENSGSVSKAALQDAIDTNISANDYYIENDRYNGKEYIGVDKSFYAAYQTALSAATDIYENDNAKQADVDAATEALTAAVAKLIPASQINATALYEATELYKDMNTSGYTIHTADAFLAARSAAETELASLFATGDAGEVVPTAKNTSDRADAVAALVAELTRARSALFLSSYEEQVRVFVDAVNKLNGIFDITDNDGEYTSESYEDFAAARAAVNDLAKRSPATLTKQEYDLWEPSLEAYWLAAYNLTTDGSAAVSLRVADTYGVIDPSQALADAALSLYNDGVTLDADTGRTLKDLLRVAGIDMPPVETGITWLTYINDILVRAPVRLDGGTGYSVALRDTGSNDGIFDWNDIVLRDGDRVTLSRIKEPIGYYYIWPGSVRFNKTVSNYNMLRFADASPRSVKEGEEISFTVEKTPAYLSSLTGAYSPRSGAKLAVYGPKDSEGKYPATPMRTDAVTDANGVVKLTLNRAGEYLVTAADVRADSADDSLYPGLQTAAAPVTVTVTLLEAGEIADAKAKALTDIEAVMSGYDADILGSHWPDAQTAYADAIAAVKGGLSLAEIADAVSGLSETLADLRKQVESGWYLYGINSMLEAYFAALPTPAELAAGKLTQEDAPLVNTMISLYTGASPYLRSQATAVNKARYDEIVAAWGEDGSHLPASLHYNITVEFEPKSLTSTAGAKLTVRRHTRAEGSPDTGGGTTTRSPFDSENSVISFNPSTGGVILELNPATTETYEITRATMRGDGYYHEEVPYSGRYLYIGSGSDLPREDIVITFHGKDLTDPSSSEKTPEELKADAKARLSNAYTAYDRSAYTTAGWAAITAAYNAGQKAIAEAMREEDIDTALDAAIETMQQAALAGEKDNPYTEDVVCAGTNFGKRVGTVTVSVENTTYDGAVPAFTGVFVNEADFPLGENDSMMTVVLRALAENGYIWTGSGGSSFDIQYLAQIGKEGSGKLAEFDGGPNSGWMGTLNDFFVNESFAAFKVSDKKLGDGDVISVRYTRNLGEDISSSWTNPDTSLVALQAEGGEIIPAFDGTVKSYILTPDGSALGVRLTPTAANKNYQTRIFLNTYNADAALYKRTEFIPVQSGDVVYIGVGERSWPSMNNQGTDAIAYTGTQYKLYVASDNGGANTAIDLINALPGTITEAQRDAVGFAETFFNALSPAEWEKVTNKAKLDAAVAALAGIDDVNAAKAAIAAIPVAAQITAANKADIRPLVGAAEAALAKLTPERKGALTIGELARYDAAVEKLAQLDAAAGTDLEVAKAAKLAEVDAEAATSAENSHTAASWVAFQSAIADIKAAIDALATVAEVNGYVVDLTAAKALLVPLETPGTSHETTLADVLAYIQSTTPTPSVGSVGGEWAVLALARGGVQNDALYNAWLESLKAATLDTSVFSDVVIENGKVTMHTKKYTENERIILALSAVDIDASAWNGWDYVSALTDREENGDYKAVWQGVNGAVFALIALDSGDYPAGTDAGKAARGYYLTYVLSRQADDGTWKEFGYPTDMTGM